MGPGWPRVNKCPVSCDRGQTGHPLLKIQSVCSKWILFVACKYPQKDFTGADECLKMSPVNPKRHRPDIQVILEAEAPLSAHSRLDQNHPGFCPPQAAQPSASSPPLAGRPMLMDAFDRSGKTKTSFSTIPLQTYFFKF